MTALLYFPGKAPMLRSGRSLAGEALALSAVLFLLFSGLASSEEPVAGTVSGVRGTVMRKRLGGGQASPVRIHDAYRVGEVLETGRGSAAQLALSDETFLNLADDSAVRINQYSFDRSTMRRTARVRILKGLVRVVLFRPRSADSLFHLETEQASVLPEMIADIAVEALQGETRVAVLGGSAGVKNASAYVIGEMRVGMNQAVTLRDKTPPASPGTISPEDRRRLLSRLRIP